MSVEDAAHPVKWPSSSGLLYHTDHPIETIDLRMSAVRALEGKAAVHLALFPRHRRQTVLCIVPAGWQRRQLSAQSRTDTIQPCGHEQPQELVTSSTDYRSRERSHRAARELHVTMLSCTSPAF